MRKQLLYSLAVSALFVGCTADETIAPSLDNKGAVNLSERPSLGNVTLGIGGESTRIGITSGSFGVGFENGDKIGACIVDQPNFTTSVSGKVWMDNAWRTASWTYDEYVHGKSKNIYNNNWRKFEETDGNAKSFYDIVDYISTNYPFTKGADNVWTSPANMVEGNYFFYAPYNQGFLTRNPLEANLPLDQNCVEAEDDMYDTKYLKGDVKVSSKAINDLIDGATPSLIGYKFLNKENSNKPEVKTYNLYSYPMFTIVNDFNGYLFEGAHNVGNDRATSVSAQKKTITIDKVEIYYNGTGANPIFNKAPFDFANVENKLKGNWDSNNFTTGTTTADVLGTAFDDLTHNDRFNAAEHLAQEPRLASVRRATIGSNHIMCAVNKTLQNGEKFHFHAVMPAGDYGNDLYARVYVTIDGKKYVMLTGNDIRFSNNGTPNDASDDYRYINTPSNADCQLIDVTNGSMPAVLIRGQHFPMAEYVIDQSGVATGTKNFAGQMLTINLSKTAAFQLNDLKAPDTNTYGFENNAQFIDYVMNNVQRGVKLYEIANTISEDDWKDQPTGAGSFALKANTTCMIDAQFIHDIYAQSMPQIIPNDAMLTFNSHLPIMSDVEIITVDETAPAGGVTMEFKAVKDGVTRRYKIAYTSVAPMANNDVQNGYNVISDARGELRAAGKNAIVEIKNGGSAIINNCSGINTIYLNNGAILTVKGNCTARVIVRGGTPTINLIENGKLSNTGNVLENAFISNDILAEINGSHRGTVSAYFGNGWPSTALPANSKVNNVTIQCPASAQIINQAQINKFQNLNKVDLTLNGLTEIQSAENVTLNKIKSISAGNSVSWKQTTSTTDNIVITKVKIDGAWTSINNIIADGLVSFE